MSEWSLSEFTIWLLILTALHYRAMGPVSTALPHFPSVVSLQNPVPKICHQISLKTPTCHNLHTFLLQEPLGLVSSPVSLPRRDERANICRVLLCAIDLPQFLSSAHLRPL